MLSEMLMPEIRKIYEKMDIAERECNEKEKKEKHSVFVKVAVQLVEFAELVRREGLLALECSVYELETTENQEMMSELIKLVVDGESPAMVEQFALIKYFSRKKDVYKALVDIMSIYGIRGIQDGTSPRVLWRMMNNLMPEDVASKQGYLDIIQNKNKTEREINIEELYQGDIRINPSEVGFFEVKLCDEIIKSMENRTIQRVLRDIWDYDMVIVLNVLSGEARKRVFTNTTREKAIDIAKSMTLETDDTNSGIWALQRVKEAASNLLKTINKLEMSGEIFVSMNQETSYLSIILEQLTQEDETEKTKKSKLDMTIKMLQDYKRNNFSE